MKQKPRITGISKNPSPRPMVLANVEEPNLLENIFVYELSVKP